MAHKLLAAFLCCALFGAQALAATRENYQVAAGTAAATIPITLGFTPTSGNLLIAAFAYAHTGRTISGVADNDSRALAAAVTINPGSAAGGGGIYYIISDGTETSITATLSGATFGEDWIAVWEFSGLTGDLTGTPQIEEMLAVVDHVLTTPVTPADNNAVLIGFLSGGNNGGVDWPTPTGFTREDEATGMTTKSVIGYEIQTTATARDFETSSSDGTKYSIIAVAAFEADSSGSAVPIIIRHLLD